MDCAPQQHAEGYRLSNVQAGFLEATLLASSRLESPGSRRLAQRAAAAARRGQAGSRRPWARWNPCCAPIKNTASAGCNFFARTISAASWRTKWAWARRCKCWPSCKSRRNGQRSNAVPDHLPDLAGFQLGGRGREIHARTSACWRCTARQRTRAFEQIPRHDLVITSYALLRRDAETLSRGWNLTPWCWTRPSTSRTGRPKTPKPSKPSARATGWC